MRDDRGTGKTTHMFEEAVALVASMEPDECVYITGPHTRWLITLKRRFKASGLVGVVVVTIPEIKQGKLKGRKGVLLVDDPEDIGDTDWAYVRAEKKWLERSMRR